MHAYLDDYGLITVLLHKSKVKGMLMFSIKGPNKHFEDLDLLNSSTYNDYFVYKLKYTKPLIFWKKYSIYASPSIYCNLHSGSIIRTKKFDEEFYYDGPLGFEYSKKETVFRIWSPVANKITLVIEEEKHNLTYIDKGLWEITLEGDHEGKKYHYIVSINDVKKRILDPYGLSSDTNGRNNYVVDVKEFRKFKYEKPYFTGEYVDASIYEASVRDFSYHSSAKCRHKGKFIGMIENHPTNSGIPTGLEYIKYLGFSHLQLMPTYDFDGIDDKFNKKYNWGYNPHQYFVPCGWYTTDSEDPYKRINEFIKLIDSAHKLDIRVVLDVVFNHVFDYKVFPLDYLVPGYFFRTDHYGNMTEVTGCQNDLATERKMTRKLIVDNIVYLAKVFNVDGFRFDLMGLLDIETMNEISKKALEIDDKVILYGEGWNMPNSLPNHQRPHMFNHPKLPGYAFFNDSYRDFIRGSQWNKTKGYALNGANQNPHDLYHLIMGSCTDSYKFSSPNQTINYVECHDNYTFYDYALTKKGDQNIKKIEDSSRLAMQLILISQGIPFIHSGQEFLRTKDLVENSYNAGDIVNRFDYNLRDKNIKIVNAIRDLLQIRKEESGLRLNNSYDIARKVHLLSAHAMNNTYGIMIDEGELIMYVKNSYTIEHIELSPGYICIYNGWEKLDNETYRNLVTLGEPGVYIFKKKE